MININEKSSGFFLSAATARQHTSKARPIVPTIETPVAMNHLFVNKQDLRGRNRFVAAGPSISNMYPNLTPVGPVSEQGHRHAQVDVLYILKSNFLSKILVNVKPT
ncbi:hypothetical protein DPMN_005340 [Dreissena polymorpha]|uniref:Uncharacterized protein n=1 Tax=Dreissena polymorpha TaxID=45954 RepID=A0A9D4RWH1_DREPO|nr:hypothetical protein DPMN_005340 [Dreissena polymorpha]